MKNIIEKLDQAGIEFYTCIKGAGRVQLSPDKLVKYLKDKKKFTIDFHGVTPELYREWELWQESGFQCVANNKKGVRCGNAGIGVSKCSHNPKNFIKGVSDRCKIHQKE